MDADDNNEFFEKRTREQMCLITTNGLDIYAQLINNYYYISR